SKRDWSSDVCSSDLLGISVSSVSSVVKRVVIVHHRHRASSDLLLRQYYSPDDGYENQNGGDLKRQQVLFEDRFSDAPRDSRSCCHAGDVPRYTRQVIRKKERDEQNKGRGTHGDAQISKIALLFAKGHRRERVQEHEDKKEENHDGPCVDDHLDRCDERRLQKHVEPGKGAQADNQEERGVKHPPLRHNVHRGRESYGSQKVEEHHFMLSRIRSNFSGVRLS